MTELILPRRKFLMGLGASVIAAPAVVRAASLMRVKALPTGVTNTIVRDFTGRVISVNVVNGGSGYVRVPSISITDGDTICLVGMPPAPTIWSVA